MLALVWSEEADADLDDITAYIGRHDLAAAVRLWERILDSTTHLPKHPYLFKASERMPGCREIVAHPNYIVIYRVQLDRIEVLRVLHARQQYP